MNARVEWMGDSSATTLAALRMALQEVLGSSLFARAPRTCKLLTYLVDRKSVV